jgi:hypothetical protein
VELLNKNIDDGRESNKQRAAQRLKDAALKKEVLAFDKDHILTYLNKVSKIFGDK